MIASFFHPEALQEYQDTVQWYNTQAPGLGDAFIGEIEYSIDLNLRFPDAWPIFTSNTRRIFLHRFPYAIIYRRNNNQIQIVAVMNLKRKPGYWQDRI